VRHSDLIEEHVPVVHRSVAILWPDVTHSDSLQRFVSAHVADLNDERVGTVIDEIFGVFRFGDEELCDDDGVVCGAAEGSVPLFLFQQVLYGIDVGTSSLTHLLAVRVGLLMTNS
jgi:hypothetical protein